MTDRLVAGMRCSEAEDVAAGFVLGALEPGEMDRVRAHLAECPEPHPELAELGSVTPALLAAVPQVEAPAALGERILAAARAEASRAPDTMATDTMATDTMGRAADTMPRPVVTAERTRPRGGLLGFLDSARPAWALAGVAAVIAVVLGAQTLRLQSERDQVAAYQRGVAAVLDLAAQPGAQLAVLKAGEGISGPGGLAAVGPSGEVRLAMTGLSPTSGSQVYEAWVIAGTGAPQPIGGFVVGSSGSAAFSVPQSTTTDGLVIALTLEAKPNPSAPTLPIIASGTAQTRPG
jgi:hypothetical protein